MPWDFPPLPPLAREPRPSYVLVDIKTDEERKAYFAETMVLEYFGLVIRASVLFHKIIVFVPVRYEGKDYFGIPWVKGYTLFLFDE